MFWILLVLFLLFVFFPALFQSISDVHVSMIKRRVAYRMYRLGKILDECKKENEN